MVIERIFVFKKRVNFSGEKKKKRGRTVGDLKLCLHLEDCASLSFSYCQNILKISVFFFLSQCFSSFSASPPIRSFKWEMLKYLISNLSKASFLTSFKINA